MRAKPTAGAAAFFLLALLTDLPAHRSPAEEIMRLTDRLASAGPDARMLTARGYEYASLGLWADAVADFRHALDLEPRHRVALHGAIDALLQQNALAEAEALARRAITPADHPIHAAPFHALHARVLSRQDRWNAALAAWRRALQVPQPEIEWFLGEAEALGRLGRHQERRAALATAMDRNPSVVLRHCWIHALVDAGDLTRATREIDQELAQSRWRSAWLVLRARVALRQDDLLAARADAAAALAEIEQRLNPTRPDPILQAEATEARALLATRTR